MRYLSVEVFKLIENKETGDREQFTHNQTVVVKDGHIYFITKTYDEEDPQKVVKEEDVVVVFGFEQWAEVVEFVEEEMNRAGMEALEEI